MEFAWEDPIENWGEFSPLFNEHFKIIYGRDVEVEPKGLELAKAGGQLVFLSARQDGKVVGYYAVCLDTSFYSQEEKLAKELGIYVTEEARGQGLASTMQEIMDAALVELGAKEVYVSYPYETTIPLRAGYQFKEVTYKRDL